MTDEVTEAEPKVVSASFTDHFVLLIRDDSSVMVLRADEGGDLDEVERGDDLLTTEWVSGSLYEDSNDVLRLESDEDSEDDGNVLIFLLSATGSLQVSKSRLLILWCIYRFYRRTSILTWYIRYTVFQICASQSTLPMALAFFPPSCLPNSQSDALQQEIP